MSKFSKYAYPVLSVACLGLSVQASIHGDVTSPWWVMQSLAMVAQSVWMFLPETLPRKGVWGVGFHVWFAGMFAMLAMAGSAFKFSHDTPHAVWVLQSLIMLTYALINVSDVWYQSTFPERKD